MKKLSLALGAFLSLNSVHADVIADQLQFRQIFLNEVRAAHPQAATDNVEVLDSVADPALIKMTEARSLDEAMKLAASTSIPNLVNGTKAYANQKIAIPAPGMKSGLTIVLVPGVFAEFIGNRAFEEVLERPSRFRVEFNALVKQSGAKDSVFLLKNYTAGRKMTDVAEDEIRGLDKVINVGEMDLNGTQVRVILFATEFSSLESLGDNKSRAEIFNRRLKAYLALTGRQNLAFVGYSRGTPLGLEMLAQAKAAGETWVGDVKAMVSLSGVVSGSALADDAMAPGSSGHAIIEDLNNTLAQLKKIDESKDFYGAENKPIVDANNKLYAGLVARAVVNYAKMTAAKPFSMRNLLTMGAIPSVDPRAPLGIIKSLWLSLGLDKPLKDYNRNIERFQYFVTQLEVAVEELTTNSRLQWWSEHDLPLNPIYYAIPGTMANPDANELEGLMFKNPLAYGGWGNYDDANLLGNTVDYARLTRSSGGSGLTLNDSQVSVPQSVFLPNAIAALRPANAGLKTKFLGVAGTHHWGMALRVVDKNWLNRSTGGRNGFPREALLRALATQILLDSAE